MGVAFVPEPVLKKLEPMAVPELDHTFISFHPKKRKIYHHQKTRTLLDNLLFTSSLRWRMGLEFQQAGVYLQNQKGLVAIFIKF